jgi:hypothetical protein
MIITKLQNRSSDRIGFYWLVLLITILFCTCAKQTNILATDKAVSPSVNPSETATPADSTPTIDGQTTEQIVSPNINQHNPLKKLLSEASWDSITEAKRQGKPALTIIRPFLQNENYQVRQMAVSCAGAIGDDAASDILSSALKDANINVRLAGAKELAKQAYPSATETVLEVIKTSPDATVRELLVKAAGFLPGNKTITTLRPLAKGKDVLADQAVYALAKLGDSSGISLVSKKLSAALPRTRYDTLQNLCYVNNSQFLPKAKQLLTDKAEAVRIGSIRNPKMRRVADASVDALVCLLNLDLQFKPSESVYTNDEINQVRDAVNEKEK